MKVKGGKNPELKEKNIQTTQNLKKKKPNQKARSKSLIKGSFCSAPQVWKLVLLSDKCKANQCNTLEIPNTSISYTASPRHTYTNTAFKKGHTEQYRR